MKTSELQGAALDWAVAKAEGVLESATVKRLGFLCIHAGHPDGVLNYSAKWALGGPIIDRDGIATRRLGNGTWHAIMSRDLGEDEAARWSLYTFKGVRRTASTSRMCRFDGPTQLIAAMRCYVALRLGENVDVPKELT